MFVVDYEKANGLCYGLKTVLIKLFTLPFLSVVSSVFFIFLKHCRNWAQSYLKNIFKTKNMYFNKELLMGMVIII